MTRKYEEIKGYWVYSVKVPSINKYYIGVSRQQCCQRWQKANYKGTALEPYLDEFDSMIKTVLIDGLTKEEAYQYEDAIIRGLQMNNLCINEQRSGLITDDINAYHKEYQRERYENDVEYREKIKEHKRQRYQNDVEYREKEKQRQKDYRDNTEYREKHNQQAKQWQKDNKEKWNEYQRQRYQKKKLEKQNQQLNLFS